MNKITSTKKPIKELVCQQKENTTPAKDVNKGWIRAC